MGAGKSEKISLAANDSAKTVADKLNGKIPGLSATARTVAEATVVASAGKSVSTTLSVGDKSVNLVGVTSSKDLAEQINSNASKLGITANYDSANDKVVLTSATGETIGFTKNTVATDDATTMTLASQGSDGKTTDPATINGDDGAKAIGQVSLDSPTSFALSGAGATQVFGGSSSTLSKVSDVDISTADGAQKALSVIDQALANIDSQRADLGAVQNRFDNTISNLTNISENASSARSRIKDTDYAQETANLSKNQVLQQAGTAILAQAKQLPQSVLSLLQ